MLLVTFGAGASFDSVPYRYWTREHISNNPGLRPPLARSLLDAQFEFAMEGLPCCHEIIAEVRGALLADRSLEDELESLLDLRGNERTACQMMALRYYLQGVVRRCGASWLSFSRATNYAALLSRLARWTPEGERVEIVTFNYDEMLEDAISLITGREFKKTDDYAYGKDYGIFKLHGSINWLRLVRRQGDMPREDLIRDAASLDFTDDILHEDEGREWAGVPAIAIPTRSKAQFECPEHHLDLLKRQVAGVDRILTIGWRGQEQNFTQLLGDLVPEGVQGLVVGSDDESAAEIATNLQASLGRNELIHADVMGFSGLIGSSDLDELLA